MPPGQGGAAGEGVERRGSPGVGRGRVEVPGVRGGAQRARGPGGGGGGGGVRGGGGGGVRGMGCRVGVGRGWDALKSILQISPNSICRQARFLL